MVIFCCTYFFTICSFSICQTLHKPFLSEKGDLGQQVDGTLNTLGPSRNRVSLVGKWTAEGLTVNRSDLWGGNSCLRAPRTPGHQAESSWGCSPQSTIAPSKGLKFLQDRCQRFLLLAGPSLPGLISSPKIPRTDSWVLLCDLSRVTLWPSESAGPSKQKEWSPGRGWTHYSLASVINDHSEHSTPW